MGLIVEVHPGSCKRGLNVASFPFLVHLMYYRLMLHTVCTIYSFCLSKDAAALKAKYQPFHRNEKKLN